VSPSLDLALGLLGQLGVGAAATLGFAVWFNVPREALLRVVLVGAGGFLVRRVLLDAGQAAPLATFWAALFVGVFGLARARTFRYPRVIFTVTGVIPLVPGAPAYESLVRFSAGDVSGGASALVRALMITLAIAGGLTGARALPRLGRKAS
jgi:uncharacterized membrane protein YjjB (DUF3815 family)